jgi:hypothetical protein
MRDDTAPPTPPRWRAAHTWAWASFVACGASVALLLLAVAQSFMGTRGTSNDHVGAGIAAAAILFHMVLVLGVAGVGLLLAIVARRRAPGDPFVELALGASMLTILALLVVGPLLLRFVG